MNELRDERIAVADPTPLGFGAMATAVFLSGIYLVGIVSGWQWLAVPFLFAGLVLILAAMWEFSNRSTFGATAFGLYGAVSLGLGALGLLGLFGHGSFADANTIMGWSFIAIAAMTLILIAGSLRASAVSVLTFLALGVAEVLLAIAFFAGMNSTLMDISGYAAIIGAVVAWYAAAAGVVNRLTEQVVLPVGAPLPQGRTAVDRPGSPVPRVELPLHPRTH